MTQEFKEEIEYTLKYPFEYAAGGEPDVVAKKLFIKAPSNKVSHFVSVIENAMSIALEKIRNSTQETTTTEPTNAKMDSKIIMQIIKLYTDEQTINKVNNAIKDILTAGNKENPVCSVNGTTKMTVPMFEDMNYQDTQNIIGEYISNFMMPFLTS